MSSSITHLRTDMTSKISLRLLTVACTVVTAIACSRSASVGSPGTTAAPATQNAASATPAGVTPERITEGKALYEAQANNCTRCHGVDAKGTNRGPNLTDSVWVQIDGSFPEIARIINEGVPQPRIKGNYQFAMAPKGRAQITDAQVNAMAAYIWSISHPR